MTRNLEYTKQQRNWRQAMNKQISAGAFAIANHGTDTGLTHSFYVQNKERDMKRQYGISRRWMQRIALACGISAMLGMPSVEASTFTWNALRTGNWSGGSNWIGGTAPVGSGHDLIFGSSSGSNTRTATNDIANNYAVQSLSFSGTTSYTLSGSSIALAGDMINSGRRSHTINMGITTGGSPITISSGTTQTGANNTITFSAFANTGGVNLTTGNATFTQAITGPGTLTTSASTRLQLSNDVTGEMNISGTVNVCGANNIVLNTGSNVTLGSTSVTQLQVGSDGQSIDPGVNYDQMSVGGDMNYGGVLELNFANLQFDAASLESFVTKWNLFVAAGSYNGDFSGVKASNAPGDYSTVNGNWAYEGGKWISPAINNGSDPAQYFGFDSTTGELVVVPEPSTMVFAGLGMAISGWHWLSKRRKAVASQRAATAC
jgi:hypothetical protein